MAKKQFTFEKEKINTTIACRIYKGDEIIFEVVNWDSLSNTNCTEVEEIVELLNKQHKTIQRLKDNLDELMKLDVEEDLLKENKQLKQQNQEYKAILQDMGLLMSDEEVIDIRNDIADRLLEPLFKQNGFDVDVDVDTSNGFTIIPKGDVE